MTIDEAIVHAREVAKREDMCAECRAEHRQLAEWLEELKELKAGVENERLIDADKLMEYCQNLKERKIDCNDIARFPTAYDVDKVVQQLEEEKDMIALDDDSSFWYKNAIDDAIEIVKDGVVNED